MQVEDSSHCHLVLDPVQCLRFTGMKLVFGDCLILFGVVWYGGM